MPSGGFVLTSNRDEKLIRTPALSPQAYLINEIKLFFPKDPQGSGTWLATDTHQTVVCLLNGGFVPHAPKLAYKHSRGLVPIHFFSYENAPHFYEEYEFDNIEPFTLMIVHKNELFQIIWDGKKAHILELDAKKPHILSSVTLYSSPIISERQIWFTNWLKQHNNLLTQQKMIDFHTFGGNGNLENDLIMTRNIGLQTVSISSIMCENAQTTFFYKDLLSNKTFEDYF